MDQAKWHSGVVACSMRGLADQDGVGPVSARGVMSWIASQGVGHIVLDAVHPELRPRILSRSARRDLAATLKRDGLGLSGVDVFVPPAHLADPAHADRASSAIIGAIGLMRDLEALGAGGGVVCCRLPDGMVDGVGEALIQASEDCGVVLASVGGCFEGLPRSVDLDTEGPSAVASERPVQVRWGGPRADHLVDLAPVRAAMLVQHPAPPLVVDLSGSVDAGVSLSGALRAWTESDPLGGLG